MSERDTARNEGRRLFLRGLGGALLALPTIPSLLPRVARAAPERIPLRHVQIQTHNGVAVDDFWPADEGLSVQAPGVRARRLDLDAAPISRNLGAAFDPLRAKMSVLRGLDVQVGVAVGELFHGRYVSTTASHRDDELFGYSIDMVLQNSRPFADPPAPLGGLRVGRGGEPKAMSIWEGRNVPFIEDPIDACRAAFGFGPSPEEESGRRRARIVDRVLEDYRATRDSDSISNEGRRQLDHYMERIRDLEARLEVEFDRRAALSCEELAAPAEDDNDARQELYIDVLVAALASGATRIASWKPTGYRDRSLDFDHSDVHARRAPWRTMMTWQYEKIARFLSRLDEVVEADGRTLLDHSLVLVSSNMGVPSHGVEGLPTLIAGNGDRVRLGEYIDYRRMDHPDLRGRPYNELLITLFQAHGLTPPEYQQEGRRGFGVYRNESEYGAFYSARDTPLPHLWRGSM